MTSFNPRLAVRRMVVKQGGRDVYDAKFHPRLNILRGENSSGKSTVLDFLFYGLGGDLSDWREAALSCSEVILEVELNGHPAVFAREISDSPGRPMRILPGALADEKSQQLEWSLHPYRRSTNKESFSQVIFRLLGMPDATGDANSNITMHQILRLLYADQLSPVDRIFRFERFDTALTRQTVGDLLCGAYDNDLYRNQMRLREATKEYDRATTEWRNALSAFDSTDRSITFEWVESQRITLTNELASTHEKAAALEERIFNAETSDGLTLKEQSAAYENLVSVQKKLLELTAQRDALQLEIVDSSSFIESLAVKLEQLRDAEATADSLKGISFIYCPSCFAALDDVPEHVCGLCKLPFDQGRAQSRILAVINETGIQLKQSRAIQSERLAEAEELDLAVSDASRQWNGLSERYRLLNRLPSTELRAEARSLYRHAGYLERQIEDLGQKTALIERINALRIARETLNAEISKLADNIETGERGQKNQLSRAYTLISSNVVKFLRSDLLRQDTFSKADSISFSFGDDRLAVNGESFFSASSMVYLRNSFFAAFLQSALMDKSFRHPRFLILDTIEDKGMEPERSHHFQNLLADMSAASDVDHQLIYATAMISPELEDSDYVVDRFYTHDDRTLRLS
jgi:hypothetical protein